MTSSKQLALARSIALIFLALRSTDSLSVGLGPLRLQSALGQPLHASVQVLGPDARSLTENCISSRLNTSDGGEILRPSIELRTVDANLTQIILTSNALIEEPAVTLLVKITCMPTLQRDYQLLLDMKDGLPRVVSTAVGDGTKLPLAGGLAKALAVDGEPGQKPRRKRHEPSKKSRAGLHDQNPSGIFDDVVPRRALAKGLSGTGSILKLSTNDVGGDFVPINAVFSLKLSNSLAERERGGSISNPEEANAAKARFQAMIRDEDSVLIAQKQVRNLTEQLRKDRLDSNAKLAAKSSHSETASLFVGVPDFNKWLIGIAGLLLAATGGVMVVLKYASRAKKKAAKPWWTAGADSLAREADLIKSARESSRSQKLNPQAAGEQSRATATAAAGEDDAALDCYVKQYVRIKVEPDGREEVAPDPAKTVAVPAGDPMNSPDTRSPLTVSPAEPVVSPVSEESANDHLAVDPRHTRMATFELVSDVMQEAEFWKLLNETQRAIDILENYCISETSESPVPWLYLFDLYGESGEVERYAALAERFQAKFNSKVPEGDAHDGHGEKSLEGFPYLMEQISALWGGEEVVNFLQSLLLNNRDEPRQGFDLLVYREILMLINLAREREKLAA